MEKSNGIGFETVVTDGISATTIGEPETTDEQDRGNEGDAERVRGRDRRRKLVRRRQRNGQGGDSDDTARDASAGADATDATDTEEYDQENFIRVKQYQSSESKKSRKKEKSQSKKAIKLEDAVEQFVDTAFSVASLLTGEPHWALDPAEREMLSDAVVAYIEAQDRRTLQKLRKVAGKYFPALNLAVVSFAIIYPRVLQSKIFLKKV